MSWHTFLSYSRQQYHFAESLASALQARGVTVWFDVQQLEPGTRWQQDIDDGLANSGTVILLASRASLDSPYVAREWGSALQQGKPVIVALIERVRLPPALRRAPLIDCRGDFDAAVGRLQIALQNPVYPRRESTFLPRLAPGVARMAWALLLRDFQRILAAILLVIMTVLLLTQASLPRYLLAEGRNLLVGWLGASEFGEAVLTLLRPLLAIEADLSTIYAGLTIIALVAPTLNLLLKVSRLQTPRFLRRRFDYAAISALPHEHQRLLWLLWLALVSGYLPFVAAYFAPVAPTSLLSLALLFAALLFISPNLYRLFQPKHPNADIARYAKLGSLSASWRANALNPHSTVTSRQGGNGATVQYHAICAPSDTDVLARIELTLEQAGGRIVPPDQAATVALILLSHNASRSQVAAALAYYPRSVGILVSRCNLPSEVQQLTSLQLVDYSRRDDDALYASLLLLTAQSDDQRARVQANLAPVSIKNVAPDAVVESLSAALLALLTLCLLTVGLFFALGMTNAFALASLGITMLMLIWTHERARRGRAALPRWGMIVLVFLPLFVVAISAFASPPDATLLGYTIPLFPHAWLFWLILFFLQIGNVLLVWRRDLMSLMWSTRDTFGMSALGLRAGAALSLLAISAIASLILTFWLLDTSGG
jgi:hypothetical protein